MKRKNWQGKRKLVKSAEFRAGSFCVVKQLTTWRWPSTAETCSHCQTNKSRSYDSCVLTDPTNPNLHKNTAGMMNLKTECEVGHSSLLSTVVKNEWRDMSTPPYAFVVCTGTTLTLAVFLSADNILEKTAQSPWHTFMQAHFSIHLSSFYINVIWKKDVLLISVGSLRHLTTIRCHYLSTHLLYWCGPLSRLPKHAAECGQEVTNDSCQIKWGSCMLPYKKVPNHKTSVWVADPVLAPFHLQMTCDDCLMLTYVDHTEFNLWNVLFTMTQQIPKLYQATHCLNNLRIDTDREREREREIER